MIFNRMMQVGFFALALPIVGHCQSLGYLDADTPGEAVGMMKSTLVMGEKMRELCNSRLPRLRQEIDDNWLKWKTTEAEVLKKTEFHWAAMVKKKPEIADTVVQAANAVIANFESISKFPEAARTEVMTQSCRNHFAALASGIWRKRTPKAYEYMDNAPEGK